MCAIALPHAGQRLAVPMANLQLPLTSRPRDGLTASAASVARSDWETGSPVKLFKLRSEPLVDDVTLHFHRRSKLAFFLRQFSVEDEELPYLSGPRVLRIGFVYRLLDQCNHVGVRTQRGQVGGLVVFAGPGLDLRGVESYQHDRERAPVAVHHSLGDIRTALDIVFQFRR